MASVLLVHHAANRGLVHPPSSLAGVAACMAARAQAVEVDVQALPDGDFALLHDALMEDATTGHGPVGAQTSMQVRGQHLLWKGRPSAEPVALLSQVIELVKGEQQLVELQLDVKVHLMSLLTREQLRALARLVEPLRARVRVSCPADWTLRALHALAPWLQVGFDPMWYLDLRSDDDDQEPPYRDGAFGYRDDHPLAVARWGAARDYLEQRAEALWLQAPAATVWYIRASVLARALDDGFDWIAFLHERGILVDAWTLDAAQPGDAALARRLVAAGVDRLTTNDAPALATALGAEVTY